MIQLLKKLFNLFWKTSDDKVISENSQPVYPESFFRGIQNETDVDVNNYLKSSAFLFGSKTREDDGMSELSIVWDDCKEALSLLLRQKNKKATDLAFKPGYATVQLSRFINTVANHIQDGLVDYERKPLEENKEQGIEANPYHGNILIHKNASDQMKKNIQHTLATIAVFTRRESS